MSNYCTKFGILCESANAFGYCSITACTKYMKLTESVQWNNVHTQGVTYNLTSNRSAEWKMVLDDFDDGAGNRELPHCTNCHRGVYKHDAGSWCPFCGAAMRNPMR